MTQTCFEFVRSNSSGNNKKINYHKSKKEILMGVIIAKSIYYVVSTFKPRLTIPISNINCFNTRIKGLNYRKWIYEYSTLVYKSSFILFRSSHRSCSVKKGVLRNFAFTGKRLCQRFFFNKVPDLGL